MKLPSLAGARCRGGPAGFWILRGVVDARAAPQLIPSKYQDRAQRTSVQRSVTKGRCFLRVEESLARQKGQSESNNEKPLLVNLLGNLFSGVISRQACVLPFDGGNKFYDIATLSSCFIRLGDCLFEIVMKYLLYRAIRISGDN